jgi:hypothetical protein
MRPPDTLLINVNGGTAKGGSLLQYQQTGGTFNTGALAVSGIGGTFTIFYAQREYARSSTLSTAINTNQTPYFGTPEPSLYIGQVAANLTVTADSSDIDSSTGNAYATVAINMLALGFRPVFNGPNGGGPQWQYNFFSGTSLSDGNTARIKKFSSQEVFTQATFCRRSILDVSFDNSDFALTPATVPFANRIVTWAVGWFDTDTGASIIEPNNFIGQVSTDPERKGFKWDLIDSLYSLHMCFSDLLNDQIPCGYFPPFDGQNMYFVMRQLGYKMGFSDARMAFPARGIFDDSNEYHLDSGSTYAPKWQPQPSESLLGFMLRVSNVCGAIDPNGAVDQDGNPVIDPMALYVDTDGLLHFEPVPPGWANNFSTFNNAQPSIAKTYTLSEQYIDDEPQLSALLALSTDVDLSAVRTTIVLAGIDPITGYPVSNSVTNTLLNGGVDSDPNAPGYLGYEMDDFDIDAQYTSQAGVDQTLAIRAQQESVPIIGAAFTALLQPYLHALTGFADNPFVGVDVYGVTGYLEPVPFWVMSVENSGEIFTAEDGVGRSVTATTSVTARGVGQAGS